MSILADIETALTQAVPEHGSAKGAFLERPRKLEHGDIATGLAMRVAKRLGKSPREVAATLVAAIEKLPEVKGAQIAGPGFVNMRLADQARCAILSEALERKDDFGRRPPSGRKVLLEFVSSNPTGPLHVGHGRGAAIGDSLARIMRFCGDEVVTEYYLNDRGLQIDVLAASLWERVNQETLKPSPGLENGILPDGAYQGKYLIDAAVSFLAKNPETQAIPLDLARLGHGGRDPASALVKEARLKLGAERFAQVREFAVMSMRGMIEQELSRIRVGFDSWYSEKGLDQSGRVGQALDRLDELGATYERDGAKWFRSSDYVDDKDRVIMRSNGEMTYFATDIAYHLDKGERGRSLVCTLLGQDHHGYVPRIVASLKALDAKPERFEFDFIQFVSLIKNGERVSMSTRSGNFLALSELIDSIGPDATRLYFVLARGDTGMDIDIDRAQRRSNDNPVHYIQYAHARICTLLENWGGDVASLSDVSSGELAEPEAHALLAELLWFPPAVANAAREREPHRIAHGLISLAAALHRYYDRVPILKGAEAAMRSRLGLMRGAQHALANGLNLLGVSAPFRMEAK